MALMCFDIQSVLTCPQMQISKAHYKKKFAVYNLTGYDVVKKRGYCALWHELLSGRKGIDIASAFYITFSQGNPSVKFITKKFQVPGHSCVQEVDAMHSVSDRYLNKLELHSPLIAVFEKEGNKLNGTEKRKADDSEPNKELKKVGIYNLIYYQNAF
nr:unnamed protein product [Callosobruchus analis]